MLENRLNTMKEHWPRRCLSEVVLARRQLHFIARRIKGLQRAIRKLIDDRDMASGLRNYLQDCQRVSASAGVLRAAAGAQRLPHAEYVESTCTVPAPHYLNTTTVQCNVVQCSAT